MGIFSRRRGIGGGEKTCAFFSYPANPEHAEENRAAGLTGAAERGGRHMPETCADKPRDCPFRLRIEALEEEVEHNKASHKEFYEKLEKSHTSVVLIEQRLEQIKEDTAEIKDTVRSLESRPARRWESMVDKALWAVCAAVIAFLLGRVGL